MAAGDGLEGSKLNATTGGYEKAEQVSLILNSDERFFAIALMKKRFFDHRISWRSPLAWFTLVLAALFLGGDPARAAEGLAPRLSIFPVNGLACPGGDRNSCLDSLVGTEGIFLPDLLTLPPFDFRLVEYTGSGIRELRFANSVWNGGEGVLELQGDYDRDNNTVVFNQLLFGEGERESTRRVGEFTYHPEHNHWHWEDFSIYEIWNLAPDGSLGEIVVTSGKVGYCMLDIRRIEDDEIESGLIEAEKIPDNRQYRGCGWRRQGISVGWVDTYYAHTPGQTMNVTGLQDGIYAFRSTVDPEGYLFEADDKNNSATVYFSLYGSQFSLIGETLSTPCMREAHPIPSLEPQNNTCK